MNARTSKWSSLHLIFIFLNDGAIMPIIYASCIATKGKLTCVCFVNIYTYMDGFYLHSRTGEGWGGAGGYNLVIRSTFTNLYL